MSRTKQDEFLAKILEEILVEGRIYRKHCHRYIFWHAGRGCTQNWHGCYYVQEELERRIEEAQKKSENECLKAECIICPFMRRYRIPCRLICTRTVLEKQGIHIREVSLE